MAGPDTYPLGRRIHVIGNSCSGKSTLAAHLAQYFGLPLVELDALNWRPNWVGLNEADPGEFERLIREATEGDSWVVTQHERKRRQMRALQADRRWSHIRFVRLASSAEVHGFEARMREAADAGRTLTPRA